jgi:hypothetical protein
VPAECLAGHGAGTGTDLEVKRPSLARNQKWLHPEPGHTGSSDHVEIIGMVLIQTQIEKQPEGESLAIAGCHDSFILS